ncbi:MAG: RpiB/LacA/LacB family sugar-phosphate isomerase [Planctomycetes bacterium]|nr:RpiB/LacA/LacB family sugar-phosphate isomerase [Planctomycetota bacterium]
MKRRNLIKAATAAGVLGTCASFGHSQQEGKNMKSNMLVIGADPFAVDLKDDIAAYLKEKKLKFVDVGTIKDKNEVAYYDVAVAAAKKIQTGEAERGILFCGSGMGMSVVANKFSGVVASVVESVYAAELCRAINDSNVLCMGAMLNAPWKARQMVNAWLTTKHTKGLEQFSDFLKQAVKEVDAIDNSQRKS